MKKYIITNYSEWDGVFIPSEPMTEEELKDACERMEENYRFGFTNYLPEIKEA